MATSLAGRLAAEIRESGPLRFDRFMERALYDPDGGYYERQAEPIGRSGDFFTSVSVGPLFGELLGFALTGMLETLSAKEIWLIEAGAHDGRLAADILSWFRGWRPELWKRMAYGIVEPSESRRAIQRRRLQPFEGKVRWFASLEEVATIHRTGVLFSNELLDALPLRRFVWRRDEADGRWLESEVVVGVGRESFVWTEVELPADEWESNRWLRDGRDRMSNLEQVLLDGFVWEHPAGAIDWWGEAARTLAEGWLVAIDYGHARAEPRAELPGGTLRAFRSHCQVSELLTDPGEQDLTADVPFDLIRRVGEAAGLVTAQLRPQGEWLTRLVARTETRKGNRGFPVWDTSRRRQLMTLIHPEHLGARFQVLVQHRLEGRVA